MSVVTAAVQSAEQRLPKIIDARTHGFVDYCHAAFFFGMAFLCRKSEPRAAVAALLTGSFILVEALLTDYPLGAYKVIPFESHGHLDAAFASSTFMVPRIFGFSDSKAAGIFTTSGFVEGAVVGATDWNGKKARR